MASACNLHVGYAFLFIFVDESLELNVIMVNISYCQCLVASCLIFPALRWADHDFSGFVNNLTFIARPQKSTSFVLMGIKF